jgi:hypothetical protein
LSKCSRESSVKLDCNELLENRGGRVGSHACNSGR